MSKATKVLVDVEVPDQLKRFFAMVLSKSRKGDPAACAESDDLLQAEGVVGGLVNVAAGEFHFCYRPSLAPEWELVVTIDTMNSIVAGEQNFIPMWECSNIECRRLFTREQLPCSQCESSLVDDLDHELFVLNYPSRTEDDYALLRKMKAIGIGLCEFHHARGAFPPVCSRSDDGRPLHSWRTLILPYMRQQELFGRIELNSAWNSPPNGMFQGVCPWMYSAGDDASLGTTNMFAVVGEQTLWPMSGARSWGDIPSGSSHTIAVVASIGPRSNWMEPSDLSVSSAVANFSPGDDVFAVLADGSAVILEGLDERAFREMLSV